MHFLIVDQTWLIMVVVLSLIVVQLLPHSVDCKLLTGGLNANQFTLANSLLISTDSVNLVVG